jgi:branched-chain amino acid aminotransferase
MMRPVFSRCASLRAAIPQASRSLGVWQSVRQYSITPEAASDSKPQDIDPSKLVVEKTTTPGALKKPEDLIFGRNFTGTYSALTLSRPR